MNIGEMPFQNNFPDDNPAMEKQPMTFANFQSTTPPEFALRKPPTGNLVSSTGRLSDIPLAEQQEGMMKPVPPASPKRPKLAPPYSNPLTGSQYVTDQTQELRSQRDEKEHQRRLETDPEYAAFFM